MYFIVLILAIIFTINFIYYLSATTANKDSAYKFEIYASVVVILFAALGLNLLALVWAFIVGFRKSLIVRDLFNKYVR